MPYSKYQETLAQLFPPWENIKETERQEILSNCHFHHFAKGETLHRGDMDCIGILLITTGELRVYMLSEEGREITLYRLHDGDPCVLSASCVLSNITFDVHIEAESDTTLLIINAPAFAKLTADNIHVECFAYKLITERFSDVMWAMQQMLFMSLDQRLAIFLVDEMVKKGQESLNLTHEQIAHNIGSAREAVSRMLKIFAEDGMVELSRRDIKIIDKQKLRLLANN